MSTLIKHQDGWRRLYSPPHMRDPAGEPFGLGAVSARDDYRLKRSMERYERRPDKFDDRPLLAQGEIGRIESFRFIVSK